MFMRNTIFMLWCRVSDWNFYIIYEQTLNNFFVVSIVWHKSVSITAVTGKTLRQWVLLPSWGHSYLTEMLWHSQWCHILQETRFPSVQWTLDMKRSARSTSCNPEEQQCAHTHNSHMHGRTNIHRAKLGEDYHMLFHISWPILKGFLNTPFLIWLQRSSPQSLLPSWFVCITPPISSSIVFLLSFFSPIFTSFLYFGWKFLLSSSSACRIYLLPHLTN